MKLHTPVSLLKGVGKQMESRLKRLGIETAEDLLHHYPFRYEDFSQIAAISELKDGTEVTIKGTIELIANKRSPRKRTMLTEAVVADESGSMRIVWFGQPYITKALQSGDTVYFSGKVAINRYGMQMVSPSYEKVKEDAATTHTARIVPMYPLTSGITQKQMRHFVSQGIEAVDQVVDWVPEDILEQHDLAPLPDAITGVHFPEDAAHQEQSERRIKFDELFLLQLRAERIRQSLKQAQAQTIPFAEDKIKAFVDELPFSLTGAQKKAAWEIFQDLERSIPMNRLLEGDVGSGKTVVAAMAAYVSVLSGQQVAIMAPTDILAKQHYQSFTTLLEGKARVGLFTRTSKALAGASTTKGKMLKAIAEHEVDVVIGTHALLSDKLQFHNLGLAIVDEQHRFGVAQRKQLKDASGGTGTTPHFLSMTATPIPRSFALTIYGDLDISIINEFPKGRKPVKTRLAQPHNRDKAYEFIDAQIEKGRQIFVVCPLISESEETQTLQPPGNEKKSVMAEYEKLSTKIFPKRRIGYLHGKMKAGEKDEVMNKFINHELDILVSTSVVEVGVNIPNATVMMIEGAERFGLAQLHQFRGRVGRSDHQSYCILFTNSDSQKSQERLQFFEQTTDGFALAEHDLQLRGPGEVYGINQSGMQQLRLASMRDINLIKQARESARDIKFETYPSLQEQVQIWEHTIHME